MKPLFDLKFLRDKIPHDRFLLIMRCLYLSNNSVQTDDRHENVRLLFDYFNCKMDDIYYSIVL